VHVKDYAGGRRKKDEALKKKKNRIRTPRTVRVHWGDTIDKRVSTKRPQEAAEGKLTYLGGIIA